MLSSDSKSQNPQSSDHKANSYARGERLGALVQKILEDFIRLCDSIRLVIRGTASNHDRSLVSFSPLSPSPLYLPLFCFSSILISLFIVFFSFSLFCDIYPPFSIYTFYSDNVGQSHY